MEAGWKTIFGKQSGLYTGNLRLPLFMSERAWWLHVESQKGGGKKRTTNKNRPKPMDLDAVRTTASLLKAEATKELTQKSSAQETVAAAAKGSSSKKGNKFKGKRREQRDKEMVMQGFSYVCRMLPR